MNERSFVELRKSSWEELSNTIEQVRSQGLRSLSRQQVGLFGANYRLLVSDLAFARTQGASEELISYLNDLAGRAHGVLYSSNLSRRRSIASFLLREFPVKFRENWRYVLTAALIFFIGWAVAADIIYTIPEAREALIPDIFDSALDSAPSKSQKMFLDRNIDIQPLDPAAISSFVMTNNIREGIVAFAGGITFGTLTVFTLFKNGLVIGGVLIVFFANADPLELLSLLLPHGFIELAAIFICGGAGLMMGGALIAPGNLRRSDSIRLAAEDALKLFAGAVPMFILAAIIEGFLTPSPITVFLKLVFSGLTLIGLLAYLGFAGK
ncbi:MAG: stage II sporulation protein M [Armatimonadetes bacterium]|nr:stage II sporulation protein M [Armatimonadota bacterium]